MGGKNWTEKERIYLKNNWGMISTKCISKNLNRTVKAIRNQAQRMELGDAYDNVDGIPLGDIAYLVGKNPGDIYHTWVYIHGLKARKIHNCLKVVTDEELARFMQEHPSLWLASECDKAYFSEYEWFNEALERERNLTIKPPRTKWNQEDTEMIATLRRRGLSFKEIAKKLNRTESSCYFRWKKIYGKSRDNTCNK